MKTKPKTAIQNQETEKNQNPAAGDAKGKATFDQNGIGSSPKYGQAGDTPNESGEGMKNSEKVIDKS